MRLFVALELPDVALAALAEWQSALMNDAAGELRAGTQQSLHVTLAFLGYRRQRDIPRIEAAIDVPLPREVPLMFEAAPRPVPERRPRLYAAPLQATHELTGLRADIADALATGAGFVDERREFWPHVTLCRVKSSVKRHRPLAAPPAAPSALHSRHFATAVTLFKSDLTPQGAVYTALCTRRI